MNLGIALRIFATDNEGQFPWRVPIAKGVSVRGRIQTATHDRFGFTKPGHHEGGGNLLFTDGSVQEVSSSKAARVFTAGLAPIGTNPPPALLIP
jgi:prepilin-type processing-associated H-X9-DG protein